MREKNKIGLLEFFSKSKLADEIFTMPQINHKGQNVLFLSDTHGKHRLLEIAENIDVVIHCGDICSDGDMSDISDFFEWYSALEIPNKIFVYGNHDFPFEFEPDLSRDLVPSNVLWLNDESVIVNEISILAISAFPKHIHLNRNENPDIIISHYPPHGILDDGYGIKEIRDFVLQQKPHYHVFGHNHSSPGVLLTENTQYINASNFNELS